MLDSQWSQIVESLSREGIPVKGAGHRECHLSPSGV